MLKNPLILVVNRKWIKIIAKISMLIQLVTVFVANSVENLLNLITGLVA